MDWRFWVRVAPLCILANVGVDWVLGNTAIWRSLLVNLTVIFACAVWLDRHRIRAWWNYRRRAHEPLVLDEDGNLHVPVIAPGETVQMILAEEDGRPLGARVLRANGTVRVQSDWSKR